MFVPAVLGCAVITLAGWLLAGYPAGSRRQRRARRADHRVPVSRWAWRPRRPWWPPAAAAPSWGSSSRATRPWSHPGRSGSWCWTRRDGQHRADVAGRRAALRRVTRAGRAPVRGRGGAGVRARGGRCDHRGRAKRNRAAAASQRFQGAARTRGARGRRRPCGDRRPRDAVRRVRHGDTRPALAARCRACGSSRPHHGARRVGRGGPGRRRGRRHDQAVGGRRGRRTARARAAPDAADR